MSQVHEAAGTAASPESTDLRREPQTDYLREAIKEDLRNGRFDRVHTRFPPEPNAYLHIGHAKAIWIDYGIAQDFDGLFNLRFDDTNPTREEQEFVDSIIRDVRWLGADWGDRLCFASDYFEQLYAWAIDLIRKGKAYVCDLSAEEVSAALSAFRRGSEKRLRGHRRRALTTLICAAKIVSCAPKYSQASSPSTRAKTP